MACFICQHKICWFLLRLGYLLLHDHARLFTAQGCIPDRTAIAGTDSAVPTTHTGSCYSFAAAAAATTAAAAAAETASQSPAPANLPGDLHTASGQHAEHCAHQPGQPRPGHSWNHRRGEAADGCSLGHQDHAVRHQPRVSGAQPDSSYNQENPDPCQPTATSTTAAATAATSPTTTATSTTATPSAKSAEHQPHYRHDIHWRKHIQQGDQQGHPERLFKEPSVEPRSDQARAEPRVHNGRCQQHQRAICFHCHTAQDDHLSQWSQHHQVGRVGVDAHVSVFDSQRYSAVFNSLRLVGIRFRAMYSVLFFCCYSFSVKYLLPEWWFCYWGSAVVSHFVGYCWLWNAHRAHLRCKGPTNSLVHCTLHITVHIHEISLFFSWN